MKSFAKKILFTLAVPLILYGCATPLADLVWPEPPAEPRIKYTTSYRSGADFKKTSLITEVAIGSEGSLSLKKPMSVHVDNAGKIFVTDTGNADIHVWDPAGEDATSFSAEGSKFFFKPIAIASDSTGRLFVTDSQADKVGVFDSKYQLLAYLTPEFPFKQPSGIAVDETNNLLYVTDTHNHYIAVFKLDTLEYVKTIGKRGKEEGQFNFPSHIALDNNGNLYVVDTMNARVQIFDSEGNFLRAFGQFGDVIGMFARPKGIAVDSEGHIYVVDAAFNNVQIFNQDGEPLLSFAGFGSDRGQLILPSGMDIDKDDYIYVVDQWNQRLMVYEFLGEKHAAREAAGAASGGG